MNKYGIDYITKQLFFDEPYDQGAECVKCGQDFTKEDEYTYEIEDNYIEFSHKMCINV